MRAIYKRELKSFMASPLGYAFMAFLILIVSIYFTKYSLMDGYPWFGGILAATTFVFLIIVPLLTMRVLAEERRQKTDQLLLTAPVTVSDIVLGKFFALLTVLAIPMLWFCLYPLLMMSFGKTAASVPMDYLSIFGFFLLGAANLAIGLFISALTENQVLSAVLTFAVLLICYFSQSLVGFIPGTANASLIGFTVLIVLAALVLFIMTRNVLLSGSVAVVLEIILIAVYALKNEWMENAIAKVFSVIDISGRLDNFIEGIFDLSGVVYYISVVALCLFLSVQAIQKRRWS